MLVCVNKFDFRLRQNLLLICYFRSKKCKMEIRHLQTLRASHFAFAISLIFHKNISRFNNNPISRKVLSDFCPALLILLFLNYISVSGAQGRTRCVRGWRWARLLNLLLRTRGYYRSQFQSTNITSLCWGVIKSIVFKLTGIRNLCIPEVHIDHLCRQIDYLYIQRNVSS